MTRNFSPISNLILIIIHLIAIVAMLKLSYGWSLEQTEAFMSAVVGGDWAQAAAVLIQLSPQILLVAASIYTLQGRLRMARSLVFAALCINGIDAYTNIVSFNEWWPGRADALRDAGRSESFVNATKPVGAIFAFIVTWFEELISLALGSMLQLAADQMEALGRRPPKFFRAGIVGAAGFDFRAVNEQASRESSHQQQPAYHPANTEAPQQQQIRTTRQRRPRPNGMRRAPMTRSNQK